MVHDQEKPAVSIDEELLFALRRKAALTNRSVTDLINEAIECGLWSTDQAFVENDPQEPDDPAHTEDSGYLAFISYSHADEKIAETIHKFLERFRVPRVLVGRETEHGKVPPRIRPVFRDQEEFSASADLGRAIRRALGSARTLIVICSPHSARSRWVGEEIRHFKQLGRSNRIYCLHADGEPVEASKGDNDRASFHPALMENFNGEGRRLKGKASEPLAVDLDDGGLSIAGTKLVAGVLGVGYDDLYQRVRRQKFRNRSLIAAVTAVILSIGIWLYVDGLREKQLNRAQHLATEARQEVYAAQPLAGLALALHAVAIAPQRDEAGNKAILATARDLAIRGRISRLGNDVQDIVPNVDGTRLAVDHGDANGELRSGTDGELIQELTDPIHTAKFLEHAPGYLIADYRGSAELRLSWNGARVAELRSPVTNVIFGPEHFFAQYAGGYTNELRRIHDGALMLLNERASPNQVAFSRNPGTSLIVINYDNNFPSELRRTNDGSLVTLNAKPTQIRLSEDAETSRMLVTYDESVELLRTADRSLVRRFDKSFGRVRFMPVLGGRFLSARRQGASSLMRSSDGSLVLAGHKITRSSDKSLVAVLAEDRAEWFHGEESEKLGSIRGEFTTLKFSKDRPPKRLALQNAGGWELRRVEDGSLIAQLPNADRVVLDTEFLFASGSEGAEIRRLDDGSVVSSLGEQVTKVSYPSAGLVQVHRQDGSEELRRLSDGHVIKAPLRRNVASDTIVGPGSEYQLIRYVDKKSELKRTADGTRVMVLGSAGADLRELIFVPDSGPSHALARYEDGRSALITLRQNSDPIPLNGAAVSIGLIPTAATRYLIIRYDDGRAEIWHGLKDIRKLGALRANLKGYSLASSGSMLTVWYADGRADVLDLNWLEMAVVDGITTERLFALACQGPLAGFDASVLNSRLANETWRGCDR